MSKAILKAYRPEWLINILNGNADILVAKKFPKDYVGWVYIYCTKNGYLICDLYTGKTRYHNIPKGTNNFTLSGKVVARFWCDKVEEIRKNDKDCLAINKYIIYRGEFNIAQCVLENWSCLSSFELDNYLKGNDAYAIHISKLEVFDRPKELSEFYRKNPISYDNFECDFPSEYSQYIPLTKAPSNYCYVEIGEEK